MASHCVICYDSFQELESEVVVYTTSCGHLFHQHCLDDWLERSNICPQCRRPVNSTMRVFLSTIPTLENESEFWTKLNAVDSTCSKVMMSLTEQSEIFDGYITQNKVMREEINRMKEELEHSRGYKEQMKSLKMECKNLQQLSVLADNLKEQETVKVNKALDHIKALEQEIMKMKEEVDNYRAYKKQVQSLEKELQTAKDEKLEECKMYRKENETLKLQAKKLQMLRLGEEQSGSILLKECEMLIQEHKTLTLEVKKLQEFKLKAEKFMK